MSAFKLILDEVSTQELQRNTNFEAVEALTRVSLHDIPLGKAPRGNSSERNWSQSMCVWKSSLRSPYQCQKRLPLPLAMGPAYRPRLRKPSWP
eukprot:5864783-Amphidinium_carterae.1